MSAIGAKAQTAAKVNVHHLHQEPIDFGSDTGSLDEGGKVNPYRFKAESHLNKKVVMTQKLDARRHQGAALLMSSSKSNIDQAHKHHRINLF